MLNALQVKFIDPAFHFESQPTNNSFQGMLRDDDRPT